jgi:SPP1 gp7 family putative phage head morphogenesis protein
VQALPQYKRLMREAEKELDTFTGYLLTTIATVGAAGIGYGLADSAALVNAMSGGGFVGLSPNAMKPLLDYLAKDGKLYARLKELTGATVDKVVTGILDGVRQGFNPRKIADLIQDNFGGGLTDALRNVRTVQLYSYRDSARANYMATDGVITGWVWFATLDDRVCLSCVAMHGTIHPLDETLNDHYNGRCAALPYIPEFGNPVEQSGKDWFDSLDPSQQSAMMGQAKLEAYQAGAFEFDKLSVEHETPVYGAMRTEASLKNLIGGE